MQADVFIAGAGPAGAAAAIAVARASPLKVILADRALTTERFGETLPGAARALLRDLGVLERFEADAHPPSLGQASIWGSDQIELRDALFDPLGPGWRLDRARLQRRLLETASSLGCTLMVPAAVTGLRRVGDRGGYWRISLKKASGLPVEVHCRFLVDATGRRASLARRLGMAQVRTDALVCNTIILPPAPPTDLDGFSMVEAAPDGWYYGARLGSGTRLVAFHTDFDLAGRRVPDAATFLAGISKLRLIGRFAGEAASAEPVSRTAAWSGRLASCIGPRWAAAGDAACCFDPLSSQGVFNALYGGLRLGNAIASDLPPGSAEHLAAYAGEIDSVWHAYRRHHRIYYKAQTRWATAPFWRRRASLPGV